MSDSPFIGRSAVAESFRGKRVLLTGHTGFKGSWLSLWLSEMGAEVVGVALPPAGEKSIFEDARVAEVIDHRIADIRSPEQYEKATKGIEADLLIHMAAQSLVLPSYDDPVGTMATNVTGTAVVLDRARRIEGLKGIVVVTSDKCYENHEWPWPYRENDQLGGADPYSASKGCAEIVSSSFARSFFCEPHHPKIATVRAGNVFGGGDWAADRLVPDIIRATLAGTKVMIRNPASVRPWQHVLEPLAGYLTVGAKLLSGEAENFAGAWNFGPPADAFIEVESFARRLQAHWGEGAAEIEFGVRAGAPHEAGMLTLDSSKARQQLGWKPQLSIEKAVSMTAEWYRACAAGEPDMQEFTLRQIREYAGFDNVIDDNKESIRICA